MDNSFEQNGGQKQNSPEEIARAFRVDITSVIAEYRLDSSLGIPAEILASHMIKSLDLFGMTLVGIAQYKQAAARQASSPIINSGN